MTRFLLFLLLSMPAAAQVLLPQEAVLLGLESDPSLAQAVSLAEAAEGFAQGAGAQPNPVLRLAATAGDAGEDSNQISQTLEVFGQPGLRGDAARAEARGQRAQARAVARQAARDIVAAYYRLWEARAVLATVGLRMRLADELEEAALKRFRVGEVPRNEYLRVQLATSQAESDFAQAEGEARQAAEQLNILLGRPVSEPVEVPVEAPDYPFVAEVEGLEACLARGLERPELEFARSRARAAQLGADLAARAGAPDLQLSAYRSTLGATAEQGVQLALVVPLFDWGRMGAERARREGLARASGHQVEVVRRQVLSQVESAWVRYRTAERQLTIMREQAARFEHLSDMARKGYEAGLLTFIEVLDAQQAYQAAQLQAVRAEADYYAARFQLHWACGDPILPEETEEDA